MGKRNLGVTAAALLIAAANAACGGRASTADQTGGAAGTSGATGTGGLVGYGGSSGTGGQTADATGGASGSTAGGNGGVGGTDVSDASTGGTGGNAGTGGTGAGGTGGTTDSGVRPPLPTGLTVVETKAPAVGGTTVGLAPVTTASIVTTSTRANTITLGAAKQKVVGFGVSLTESSAVMLDSIAPADRTMIIDEYFNPAKGGMTLVRLPIGTTEFALADYSYQDSATAAFSIAHDETSGLIKLILDAQAAAGGAGKIDFIATPWTAPPWMKSSNSYIGGTLNTASYQAFADYVKNYIAAYAAKGIPIWGVTPQCAPEHMGQFPTMGFPSGATGHAIYIATALGPTLKAAYPNIKVLGFDQNKGSGLVAWATAINGNATARGYTDGIANRWEGSSVDPGEASLETVRMLNPSWLQIATQQDLSAINDATVVNAAWMNDTWFWTRSSNDWGTSTDPANHPIVNGMFRYIEDIIVTFNHWQQGWIQFNAVTDKWGGPSHGTDPTNAVHGQSPFMVDVCGQAACAGTAFAVRGTKAVFKVPTLYALEHFSKYFLPDGTILTTTVAPAPPPYYVNPATAGTLTRPSVAAVGTKNPDSSIVVNILNMNDTPVDYQIVLPDNRIVETTIAAKAIQTVLVK